jgi:exopolyphosphatase/guanosine-5'-triphosphate,3'-diphosphate pyrophosphatase
MAEAQRLFAPVAETWGLDESERDLLNWSAELHEIGLALAHSRYHKHGEYILTHADLPGFSRLEQAEMALLVRAHRRRLQKQLFEDQPKARRKRLIRLAILLRLAVLLHRSRTDETVPIQEVTATRHGIALEFAPDWLADHPLTAADLENEAEQIAGLGFTLKAR